MSLKNKILKRINKYFLPNKPISTVFGFDRGTPIDRYYIEKFLFQNKEYIKGVTVEIAESFYTTKFGQTDVTPLVLHVTDENADIVGDLVTGEGIPCEVADCIILTQTLSFMFDLKPAVQNVLKMLKKGGVLLLTNPGITQISKYDYDRWGHYWSFTDQSIKALFEEFVAPENIKTVTYGNVKVASAFLYGYAYEELSQNDLNYSDNTYQLVIGSVIKK